ncbi:hypothetical protein SAMN04488034_103202 [Salinimicrobium catena]|uniref:DUF4870 domain-containing protein n=1 Tax=Salinimicrobium catena TaxID=390640 RepID=A0A1H5MYM2_9FLAO|nr:DUF4870 domain-containing protein [Salinimicrobium catena]SDL32722.1 hypothetical protein SAMN04488140_103202 [Salinimicrobium catena]SEE94424.1 hypothetical protein SAMN04488034_103202 [Salinimicrobium catena]
MKSEIKNPDKTVAALIHLSTFSQFFFPLGNFIFPLILWMAKKEDAFVNEHGKQALNFQLSLYLYSIFLIMLGVAGVILIGLNLNFEEPFYFNDHFRVIGNPAEAMPLIIFALVIILLLLTMFVLNIYGVISATIKANEGELYQYPLTINFITPDTSGINQSKNEQFTNTQNQTL